MNHQRLLTYLRSMKGVSEEFPFGPSPRVFKVMGKMFALVAEDTEPMRINLKCQPEDAMLLRSTFSAVQPGFHMNKEHWNTVILDGSIPHETVFMMIDHSYEEVVKKLKKSLREKLSRM